MELMEPMELMELMELMEPTEPSGCRSAARGSFPSLLRLPVQTYAMRTLPLAACQRRSFKLDLVES
ncbi:hypothetical protein EYF80_063542 [Liparis tanakae]|uniref:Uncharacterized protein n=1 Tax=Liparis tanakae TaxID=230148 RepID=A0A4Z2EC58_9TELE|nr:hypothetical protein EYF80_063542 [Liparis tanakae]